jgi:choline dehydrogenase
LTHSLREAGAGKRHVLADSLPGEDVRANDELLNYARHYGGTCYHAGCTCRMGKHRLASSTISCACTIMIAEKGTVMIEAAARERLAA